MFGIFVTGAGSRAPSCHSIPVTRHPPVVNYLVSLTPITIHKLTLQLDCFTTLQCVAFLSYQFSPHMLPYQTCRRGKHDHLESQAVTLGLLQASLFSLLTPLGQACGHTAMVLNTWGWGRGVGHHCIMTKYGSIFWPIAVWLCELLEECNFIL